MPDFLLHISPCPNDTFMFDAWINHRSNDFWGWNVQTHFYDIKTLNELAEKQIPDITKLSVFAASKLLSSYQVLTSGAAIGYGNGPLIISKKPLIFNDISNVRLAVPGFNTTAFALLKLFFPKVGLCKEYFFNEIEDAILNDEADAGLIIHETRFTYEKKGLVKVADLGEMWEKAYRLPLPLGVIAVKRSLPDDVKKSISDLLQKSILYAFNEQASISSFVAAHAQIHDDEVIRQHIQLYVNDMSIELGEKGKRSIEVFFNEMIRMGFIKQEYIQQPIFV